MATGERKSDFLGGAASKRLLILSWVVLYPRTHTQAALGGLREFTNRIQEVGRGKEWVQWENTWREGNGREERHMVGVCEILK